MVKYKKREFSEIYWDVGWVDRYSKKIYLTSVSMTGFYLKNRKICFDEMFRAPQIDILIMDGFFLLHTMKEVPKNLEVF